MEEDAALIEGIEAPEEGVRLLTLAKIGRYTDTYLWLCRRAWMRERSDEERLAALRSGDAPAESDAPKANSTPESENRDA